MTDARKLTGLVRARVLESILIVLAGTIAALAARYSADHGLVPEVYVMPIQLIIVLIIGYIVIRIVNRLLERIAEPKLGITRTQGLKNFFQLLAGIALIISAFAIFGFDLTGALVSAGFLGIVLGLAAQQTLGNIFAGLSLFASRPFEIGDRVTLATSSYTLAGSTYPHESQISGFTGVVQDIGIFFTRMMLDSGSPAVFPNSVVIGALIVNYSRVTSRAVRVRMDLDKKTDYDKFKSRLMESLKKYETVDAQKSGMEIVDLGATTYQVAITVWTRSELEEPVKTIVIREGMKAQQELSLT